MNAKEGIILMTTLKKQAIEILKNVPEEKMVYVVDVLKWLDFTFSKTNQPFLNTSKIIAPNSSEKVKIWNEFKKYKGIIDYDIDEKTELANARDEKHESFA